MFTDIAKIDLPRSRRDTKRSMGIVIWTVAPDGEHVRWQCKKDGSAGWYRRWADAPLGGKAKWLDTNLWPQELQDLIVCGFDLPKPEKPKPDVKAKRAAKAAADLARWQRRLKLAQTKVKHYRKRVRYYDRVAAK